jgi:nitrogen-specific signal transduction histidine kinase/outer membrane biosynthesis protein TonB
MFKKVQLKFFAIITSIIFAVFLAILVSVNLITEAVMQRQSRVVLNEIAEKIVYDEETSTFSYISDPPDKVKKEPDNNENFSSPSDDRSTEKSSENSSSDSSTDATEEPTTETPTTEEPSTGQATENSTEETEDTPVDEEVQNLPEETPDSPEDTPTESPADETQTTPEQPVQTPEESSVTPEEQETPEESPDVTSEDNNYPDWEHWNEEYPDEFPYEDYGDNYEDDFYPRPDDRFNWFGRDKRTYEEYEEEQTAYTGNTGGIQQLSFTADSSSVLDGYTVLSSVSSGTVSSKVNKLKHFEPVPDSVGTLEFFVLMADKDGNFLASLHNDTLDSEIAQKYINAIIKDGSSSGMLNSYQFCSQEKDNGTIMVFTDKSAEMDMISQLNHTTLLIGILSFIGLSVLTFFLSKKSIEPIKVAFEKQKQFVSDASHELKTPLTIISANADVLADEIGENKWLTYIKSQTERMNVLVNDLLNLTRLENDTSEFICGEFNLSKAIENTALPFECQAFEDNKKFDIDIQDGLTVVGSEKHIKQMAAIFIDNALKYSNDGGTVRITLRSQGDKKILSVYNTGTGIKNGEENKIFERFYRSDDSRARATGGYGLGLAIAKSIIDKHKFKITVDNIEGTSICFNVIM